MSPPCRRTAAPTSGDHPEPHPDLCSPTGPDLRERGCGTFGPTFAGLSALATGVHRASLSEGGGNVPTGPGWPQGSRCNRARETGGVTLPTGHLVGRAHELAWPVSVVSDRAEISE